MNGNRVWDQVLDPAWTSYDKVILYSTYDVTKLVVDGENAMGVILGFGRYAQKPRPNQPPYITKFIELYGQPNRKLILQLMIRYVDGGEEVFVSDDTWNTEYGPVVEDDLCDGETYDARLERSGWWEPSYDDSGWSGASLAVPPGGELASQATLQPIRRVDFLKPLNLSNPKPGLFIYDFGQNFAGWAKLRVQGPRGTQVKLRFSELLSPDGTLNTKPNRSARAEDVYILKGGGVEIYEPRFTYHGFRYVEVSGYPGTPGLDSVEGVVVNSDVRTIGGFSCSNQLLNDVHKNIVWGQRSNMVGIPTDCPQRDERLGWTGDAQLAVEEALLNFDSVSFFTKYLRDIRVAQRPDGSLPNFAPACESSYPPDPAWGSACIILPWYIYLQCGDVRVLEENYWMMRRWVDFLESQSVNHITKLTRYGDWCPPGQIKSLDTSGELISTWYHLYGTMLLYEVEKVLGKVSEAEDTLKLVEKIKAAFNGDFLKDGRYYDKGSQTSNALPLYLDMGDEATGLVLNHLVEDLIENHDGHLSTGILGTRYILDALTKHGHPALAYGIVSKTTYPGWGYMIREGATTLWERWEYIASGGMNSHNHIMFGSVDAWFYRVLAGLEADADGPGFEHIKLKPTPIGDLTHVSASVETVRGIVSSRWRIDEEVLFFDFSVPVNSRGTVYLPCLRASNPVIEESGSYIWKNETFVKGVPGVYSGEWIGDYITLEIGSGEYSFRLSAQ